MKSQEFRLNNKDALPICKALMSYFKTIYGKGIISGQHTNYADGDQLEQIYSMTGKYPALRGFDLLSYTEGIHTPDQSPHCIEEIRRNKGSVEAAIKWWEEGGLVTLCWHWYSPIIGVDKSFYTDKTTFDFEKALCEGTEEYKALNRDIEQIAKVLQIFKEKNIPILWRPLHEAEGTWFWWGSKGPELYIKLYRFLYHRLTDEFKLNNLIWIWASPNAKWYVGDAYCDMIGSDVYGAAFDYGAKKNELESLNQCALGHKPLALTESFIAPSPEALIEEEANWLYFMIWNWEDDSIFEQMSKEHIKEVYNHPYVITKEDLPSFT